MKTRDIANASSKLCSPETGGRSFEENALFFVVAKEQETWQVRKVNHGDFCHMPRDAEEKADDEETPLLQ